MHLSSSEGLSEATVKNWKRPFMTAVVIVSIIYIYILINAIKPEVNSS